MKNAFFVLLMLVGSNAFASLAECKVAIYRFNKAHSDRLEAVGVFRLGSQHPSLGFRRTKEGAADVELNADLNTVIRACVLTKAMTSHTYHFGLGQKLPSRICDGYNRQTLSSLCHKWTCSQGVKGECDPPRLFKVDKAGKLEFL